MRLTDVIYQFIWLKETDKVQAILNRLKNFIRGFKRGVIFR